MMPPLPKPQVRLLTPSTPFTAAANSLKAARAAPGDAIRAGFSASSTDAVEQVEPHDQSEAAQHPAEDEQCHRQSRVREAHQFVLAARQRGDDAHQHPEGGREAQYDRTR